MRIPNTAHTSRPWRIHDIARDFRLQDVWELPTPGGSGDFPQLVQLMTSLDPSRSPAGVVRMLFAVRWKVGKLLSLDRPGDGVGSRVSSLRDQLPTDLRDGPSGPDFESLPFAPMYLTHDEFAAELANRTMHGILHLSWVPDETAGYRGRMAVYVKRNGLLGTVYMAAIEPFRRLLYPMLLRRIGQSWQAAAVQ